jgi:hypothetical protein
MKIRIIITTLAALAATFSLHGQGTGGDTDSGNTTLNSIVTGDGLSIVTQEASVTFPEQTIGADGLSSMTETTNVEINDLRGTNSTITVEAVLTPLTGTDTSTTDKIRGTRIIAGNFDDTGTGELDNAEGITASAEVAITEDGAASTTESSFVSTVAMLNRHFSFDITITADAMDLNNAESGNYAGEIALTIN